jgi:hypothetical protein
MGVLKLSSNGSFSPSIYHEEPAITHGHVHAVREMISYLQSIVLPQAIRQDARLRAEGAEPAEGFKDEDAVLLDAFDASQPPKEAR